MNIETYEPLVRRLCAGIRDPHLRSEAEQEGRIRLWLSAKKVDDAADPSRMANRVITRARKDALFGHTWTGNGRDHKKCEHGAQNRRPDGRCRTCRAEIDRRRRQLKRSGE